MSLGDRIREKTRGANRAGSRTESGPGLAVGFLNGEEVGSASGTCYLIAEELPGELRLPGGDFESLTSELRLIYGIGSHTESRLRMQGVSSLHDLKNHHRFGRSVELVLEAIETRDIYYLWQCGASEEMLLSAFRPEDVVCLDIETTGLRSDTPLFLVGLLRSGENGLQLQQFLARDLHEEKAVLELAAAELSRYRVLMTYNGKSFDIPYLRGRLAYHRINCPLRHFHLDLLHHVRRRYRQSLTDCRLTTVENELLGTHREEDIPSALIPEVYNQFTLTQDTSLIEPVIKHNAGDLFTLARITKLVFEFPGSGRSE